MSATNTTTNYNLPIFIGSDKPAWLVDFNGAMNAIDAQMKVNADAIATKSPILTFNDTTDIDFTVSSNTVRANLSSGVAGTVSRALLKDISSPVSQQIVSVDTSNNQQMLTIGTGLSVSSGTLYAIDLNLTDTAETTSFTLPSGYTYSSGSIYKALNSSKTVGKIYGSLAINSTNTSGSRITIPTGFVTSPTGSAYNITSAGWCSNLAVNDFSTVNLLIGADGSVSIDTATWANTRTYIYLWPCLYFFKDFGDNPTP